MLFCSVTVLAHLLLMRVCSEGEVECVAGSDDAIAPKTDCGCSNLNRLVVEGGGGDHVPQREEYSIEGHALANAAIEHNKEMAEISPGNFFMGEVKEKVHFKQDGEGPLRRVRMSGFRMDKYEVSNSKFLDFVEQTGYVTEAERFGDSFVAELYLSNEVSLSIDKKVEAVPWWLPVPNASWRRPEGIDSGLEPPASRFGDRSSHPVVHVSWNDANAYCQWRNASLPTEAQWEYAARGGVQGTLYPWGDDHHGNPKRHRMNIWQGTFPTENKALDKFSKTAPVSTYGEQNQWGLYNMVGNVWEWVSDWFTPVHFLTTETQHLGFIDPQGPSLLELEQVEQMGYLKREASGKFEKVKKGGSFMCHKSYCWRYRICARSKLTVESSAHHVGFRCARAPADELAAHWSMAPENADAVTLMNKGSSDASSETAGDSEAADEL